MMMIEEINISPANVYGKCDLKCVYNYKYPESTLTAKNNGVNISLTYENGNVAPVMYNNNKYIVAKILIFSPSLHIFNDNKVDAEIIIEHTPEAGGSPLFVCIPIAKSADSSSATTLVSDIVRGVGSNAPAANETTTMNISGFTLDKIIPKGPFFSYSGKYSEANADFIVYGKMYAIPVGNAVIAVLGKILRPFPLPMQGEKLFVNAKGANSSGRIGDGIYISCQPTGSSEEQTDVTNNKDSTSTEFDTSWVEYLIKLLIGCIVFLAIFYAISYGFNSLSGLPMPTTLFKKKT
jgi:hypothetical protein